MLKISLKVAVIRFDIQNLSCIFALLFGNYPEEQKGLKIKY